MSVEHYHLKNTTWERIGYNGAIKVVPYLPWNLTAVYSPTAPPVAAHYFTQFARRVSSAQDYYQHYWCPPGEMENTTDHAVYGGFTRDHPLTYRYETTSAGWEIRDMKVEVREAIAAGMDGWTIDMLDIDSTHWNKMNDMASAVDEVNVEDGTNFWIVFMPDGTSSSTAAVGTVTTPPNQNVDSNASADLLADKINELNTTYNCLYAQAGSLLIAPFAPELWPSWAVNQTPSTRPAFWQRFKTRMETVYSTPTDLWMCYVAVWTGSTAAPAMNSFSYGHGRWGDRDPVICATDNNSNRGAAQYCWDTYTKPWMHFGAPGDTRPRSDNGGTYKTWESWGSRNFDASWKAAIGDATHRAAGFQQVVTWNDYTEHAHICPSKNNGYNLADLNTYYVEKFKTGSYPTIVRDGIYLMHRLHHSTVTLASNSRQTRLSGNTGGTPPKDDIEVRAFLTAAATVEVLRNGVVIASFAGVTGDNIFNTALPSNGGTISARATRSSVIVPGTVVTSRFPLQTSPLVDDKHYRGASSLREGTFS